MEVKKVISICKKSIFYLYTDADRGIQWLSDGNAIYPLIGLPIFDTDSFCTAYDIDKDKTKIIERSELPKEFDFSDVTNFENIAEIHKLRMHFAGKALLPIITKDGIEFIDSAYMCPFVKYHDKTIYLRKSVGTPYFVIKNGFELLGVILPESIINNDFIKLIKEFTCQCEKKYMNIRNGELDNA